MVPPKEKKPVAVGMARGDSVRQSVARAVEMAGGLGFIKPGQTVLIKPNCNSPDPYPGTTNPEVLYEVVRLVWEQDPRRVIVGDRSYFRGTTPEVMRVIKIYDAAMEARAEVIPFDDGPWKRVHPEKARHWPEGFSVPGILELADHIITLPVLKTHFLATYTMALKNAVGMIPPEERLDSLHKVTRQPDGSPSFSKDSHNEPAFGSRIAELNLVFNPSLVIMDGTRAFVSGGPATGDMVEPGVLFASPDRIANDVVGLAFLKVLGTTEAIMSKSVWEQPQVKRAVELGLGVQGPEGVLLQADGIAEAEAVQKMILQ